MGKFDGILICADWDGTLFYKGEVPKESVEAIKYFQSEGGKFTVCSGRNADFLKSKAHFVRPNTYALCLNGACVCDLDSDTIIKEGFIGPEAYELVDRLLICGAKIKTVNVWKKGASDAEFLPIEEYRKQRASLINAPVYKITLSGTDESDGEMMAACAAREGAVGHTAVRSFSSYIEILKEENTKGVAAKFLKELTRSRLLVGMGDYENDISLLSEADIGYAVGNAIDSVKAVADRVTARVDECAVARVIEELEQDFVNNN